MEPRRIIEIVRFQHPFALRGVDRVLAPGNYKVITEEELIEGLSFPAYRRISTVILAPAPNRYGRTTEMLTVDPADLAAVLERDAVPPR